MWMKRWHQWLARRPRTAAQRKARATFRPRLYVVTRSETIVAYAGTTTPQPVLAMSTCRKTSSAASAGRLEIVSSIRHGKTGTSRDPGAAAARGFCGTSTSPA